MMKKNLRLAFFLLPFFLLAQRLNAQNDLKIGQWRAHFPYRTGISVAQSDKSVFWATGLSVLRMDKTDFSIEKFDKINALSDVGARLVRYNAATKQLLVAYENNNLDLVNTENTEGSAATVNLPDIKNNVNIIGDKTIYNVAFDGSAAYLACGFGISKLDLVRHEFVFTTFTKIRVFGVAVFDGKLWAATENGLFYVPNNANTNLSDFSIWQKLNATNGAPPQYASRNLTVFDGKLFFDINDTLEVLQQNRPVKVLNQAGFTLKFITSEGKDLVAGFYKSDDQGRVFLLNNALTVRNIANGCINRPTEAVQDAAGRMWFADQYNSYRFQNKPTDGQCTTVEFDSPYSRDAFDIAATDTSVWVAFGGINGINPRSLSDGFATLTKDGKWLNYNGLYSQVLIDSSANLDANCVAINPKNGKTYVGTFPGGVVEMTGTKITKIWNETNSAVQRAVGDPNRRRIAGLDFDKNGVLWVSNNLAERPLIALKADGKTWLKMAALPTTNVFQLIVDAAGLKWLIVKGSAVGLVIYDEGKNIDDLSDDKIKLLDNSNLPKDLQSTNINCITPDLDGRVWVGTSSGVAVFECGSNPFSSTCNARLVVSSLGSINEYLLREKNVNVIAVDGANRKWFGTSSGLFVTSSDGREEIAKYNIENSPLPSNNITALAIRPSGEVFVGTDRGLMSLRGEATEGGTFNAAEDKIVAFPNPVRPNYDGDIAIKGFARDADVKIADVNGNVVFETRALGGQAIWHGKDFNGQRVATGVYLVLATNTRSLDNPEGVVAKILFIN